MTIVLGVLGIFGVAGIALAENADTPAPIGASRTGTWWSPGADSFTASSLWFFDPIHEAVPYGWRKDYQPTGSVPGLEIQFSFVYTWTSGGNVTLEYPSGTRQELLLYSYDEASDTMTVQWDGYWQTWYGCQSGAMPLVALAACE